MAHQATISPYPKEGVMGGVKIFRTVLFCLAGVVSLAAAGDLTITFRSETKVFRTKKSTEVHYYSEQYKCTNNESAKTDTLIDYKNSVLYQVNHKKKTIEKLTLDDALRIMEALAAQLEESPEAKEKMGAIFGDANDEAKIEKVGSEVILGRTCDKWKVSLGKNVTEISADPSLAAPIPQAALENTDKMEGVKGMMAMIPGIGKLQEAASKIKGVPLKTQSTISVGPMTVRGFSESTKIEEGPIPASRFELPKGYKEKDLGKEMLEEINKKRKKK
jgi:hypothetical protein